MTSQNSSVDALIAEASNINATSNFVTSRLRAIETYNMVKQGMIQDAAEKRNMKVQNGYRDCSSKQASKLGRTFYKSAFKFQHTIAISLQNSGSRQIELYRGLPESTSSENMLLTRVSLQVITPGLEARQRFVDHGQTNYCRLENDRFTRPRHSSPASLAAAHSQHASMRSNVPPSSHHMGSIQTQNGGTRGNGMPSQYHHHHPMGGTEEEETPQTFYPPPGERPGNFDPMKHQLPAYISFVNTVPLKLFKNITFSLNKTAVSVLTPISLTMALDKEYSHEIWDPIGWAVGGWPELIQKSRYRQTYFVPLPIVSESHGIPCFAKPTLTLEPSDIISLLRTNNADMNAFVRGTEKQLNYSDFNVSVICEFAYVPGIDEANKRGFEKDGIYIDLPSYDLTVASVRVPSVSLKAEIPVQHEDPKSCYITAVLTQRHKNSLRWNTFSLSSEGDDFVAPGESNCPLEHLAMLDASRNVRFSYSPMGAMMNRLYHCKGVPLTLNYQFSMDWAENVNDTTQWNGFSNLVRSHNASNYQLPTAPAFRVSDQASAPNAPYRSIQPIASHPFDKQTTIHFSMDFSEKLADETVDVFILGVGRHIWRVCATDITKTV